MKPRPFFLEPKFTRGPWLRRGTDVVHMTSTATYRLIAECGSNSDPRNVENAEAIAILPEVYRLLIAVAERLSDEEKIEDGKPISARVIEIRAIRKRLLEFIERMSTRRTIDEPLKPIEVAIEALTAPMEDEGVLE